MTRTLIVLVIAAIACSACGAGNEGASGPRSVQPIITHLPADNATRPDDPSELPRSPTGIPARPAVSAAPDGCPSTSADRFDKVVALAIDGLAHTTAADVWSSACAQVEAPDTSVALHTVTVKIGWMGTLHEYASIPGASAIVSLADEAYVFDAGHQVALRSGELVAVVSCSGGIPSDLEALARQVGHQLRLVQGR